MPKIKAEQTTGIELNVATEEQLLEVAQLQDEIIEPDVRVDRANEAAEQPDITPTERMVTYKGDTVPESRLREVCPWLAKLGNTAFKLAVDAHIKAEEKKADPEVQRSPDPDKGLKDSKPDQSPSKAEKVVEKEAVVQNKLSRRPTEFAAHEGTPQREVVYEKVMTASTREKREVEVIHEQTLHEARMKEISELAASELEAPLTVGDKPAAQPLPMLKEIVPPEPKTVSAVVEPREKVNTVSEPVLQAENTLDESEKIMEEIVETALNIPLELDEVVGESILIGLEDKELVSAEAEITANETESIEIDDMVLSMNEATAELKESIETVAFDPEAIEVFEQITERIIELQPEEVEVVHEIVDEIIEKVQAFKAAEEDILTQGTVEEELSELVVELFTQINLEYTEEELAKIVKCMLTPEMLANLVSTEGLGFSQLFSGKGTYEGLRPAWRVFKQAMLPAHYTLGKFAVINFTMPISAAVA